MPRAALPSPADPASYRALTRPPNARYVEVIDQRALPHALVKINIGDAEAAALAIRRMWVRGAPLIGAVGAYGLALALDRDAGDAALATCGWGTALAPLFRAHTDGLALHVWVSETRPRMQGANLTAWELDQRGIPHTLFADSASGLLMQRGDVDVVFVGADRVARNGDVCNKIGTYDKALAARDNNVPFYVALPSPTIDWKLATGAAIPIEARDSDEVLTVAGRDDYGQTVRVAIAPHGTKAVNYAFDVTPARLVSGLVTERGVTRASSDWLAAMFPEQAAAA